MALLKMASIPRVLSQMARHQRGITADSASDSKVHTALLLVVLLHGMVIFRVTTDGMVTRGTITDGNPTEGDALVHTASI